MVLEADMIVGADGQHSTVRLSVEETRVKPKTTDTVAFTGSVPMRKILEDDILNQESIAYSWVYWLGPRRCFMGESSLPIGRSPVIHHVLGYPIVSYGKGTPNVRTGGLLSLQSLDTEYSVHLYWDHSEPDVPEGWTPNLPAKFLKLAETTSDRRYGWISQIQYGRFLTKTPQTDEDVRKNRIGLLAKIPGLARD